MLNPDRSSYGYDNDYTDEDDNNNNNPYRPRKVVML
jgi:hypothetical protein